MCHDDHSSGILTPLQTKLMPLLHLENQGFLLGGLFQRGPTIEKIKSVFVFGLV